MKIDNSIIKSPYITEKSNEDAIYGKYTFIVDVNATKTEIKNIVEDIFGVKVLKVNTQKYRGKIKRMGVHQGPRPDWKKAIVKIDTNPEPGTYLSTGGKTVTENRKYKTSIEEFGISQ